MDTSPHDTAPDLLVVEDDDALAALLVEYLGQHGFAITRVASGTEGAQRILETRPDLVVLDLMLPGMNGLDVCRRVRDRYDGAIVMLTASQSEADHVTGLELGADDFVVKPIEPRVLLARLRTQLRRVRGHARPPVVPPGVVRVGALEVDVSSRDARVGGDLVPLTTMEFDVLRMLAENAGEALDRDRLYREVMEMEYDGLDRGMDVHVSRIRRKLEEAGFDTGKLKSVRGVGYLLAPR
jgi:DNA-binding response OmpR family regulator